MKIEVYRNPTTILPPSQERSRVAKVEGTPIVLNVTGGGGGGHATWVEQEWAATPGQVTFILAGTPTEATSLSFFVNGVMYDDDVDFTRSGNTITWLNAAFTMESGDKVHVRYY